MLFYNPKALNQLTLSLYSRKLNQINLLKIIIFNFLNITKINLNLLKVYLYNFISNAT